MIASEMADTLLLLTGVLFMTFQEEVHLAAVGLIDAYLLCSLAFGNALSSLRSQCLPLFSQRKPLQPCGSQGRCALDGSLLKKTILS